MKGTIVAFNMTVEEFKDYECPAATEILGMSPVANTSTPKGLVSETSIHTFLVETFQPTDPELRADTVVKKFFLTASGIIEFDMLYQAAEFVHKRLNNRNYHNTTMYLTREQALDHSPVIIPPPDVEEIFVYDVYRLFEVR